MLFRSSKFTDNFLISYTSEFNKDAANSTKKLTILVGDMDKIEESKYIASGVSVLRNSDGELISVVRVDATRYLDDPIIDKFLKSDPDYLIKQGTINGERVSLHKVEVDYNNPDCLDRTFEVAGYNDECNWYHRAFVTMLGINDEQGE